MTVVTFRRRHGWPEVIHTLAMKRKTIIEDLEGRLEALREFGFNPNDSIDDVKGKDAAYALGRRDELDYALKLLREAD